MEVKSHTQKKGCTAMETMYSKDTSNMSKSAAWLATHVDIHRHSVRTDTMCDPCGGSSTYSEVIDTSTYSFTIRKVYSSGCPNHYNYITGRQYKKDGIGVEGDKTWSYEQAKHTSGYEIPAEPLLLSESDAFDMEFSMGLQGIALNGVAFYGGAVDADGNLLDVTDDDSEWTSFDFCSGHASGFGEYHYHFPPSCLLASLPPFSAGHSPQIGWALDGFPIYGPKGPNGVAMRVCSNSGADSTYCLDSCSGYEGALSGIDNFMYRYYITGATSDLDTLPGDPRPSKEDYPFTIKCFRGCTVANYATKAKCKRKSSAGYDESYVVAANSGFTETLAFENDRKCSATISTTTTTTTASTCESWCATNEKDWSKKCNWPKCVGCADCS